MVGVSYLVSGFRLFLPLLAMAEVMHVGPADASPAHGDHDLARACNGLWQIGRPKIFGTVEEKGLHIARSICRHICQTRENVDPGTVARLIASKSQAMPSPGLSDGMA